MFVIFVPSKQFEQGWWAQPCAETVSNGVLLNSSGSSNSSPPTNSTVKVNDEVGINLKAALNACQNGGGGDERHERRGLPRKYRDSVTCDIKGQNLDQVAKLRLRNSADQTDSKTAEGDVSVNGDAKAAKVSFPLSQVGPLEPKSGVKFTFFVQICPKIGICSPDLCSSRLIFTKVASAFQWLQPVNSTPVGLA